MYIHLLVSSMCWTCTLSSFAKYTTIISININISEDLILGSIANCPCAFIVRLCCKSLLCNGVTSQYQHSCAFIVRLYSKLLWCNGVTSQYQRLHDVLTSWYHRRLKLGFTYPFLIILRCYTSHCNKILLIYLFTTENIKGLAVSKT